LKKENPDLKEDYVTDSPVEDTKEDFFLSSSTSKLQ